MNIRPLTRADLVTLWETDKIDHSVRGFVAEKDGEILGLTGLMYLPTTIIAFADMKVEGHKYPMSIMRITKLMKGLMREVNVPIFAAADPNLPNSRAFLEHVGFERVAGVQYCFKNKGK